MADAAVQLTEERYADVAVIRPSGRLDQNSSQAFQARVLRLIAEDPSPSPHMVMDMTGIEYVSSVGLRALMIVAKQCHAADGRLALTNLSPMVAEIFEISRFDLIIENFEEVREAIASISEEALASYDAQSPA